MKHKALFSSKDKGKKIQVSFAAILLGALRVNFIFQILRSILLFTSPKSNQLSNSVCVCVFQFS